MDKRQGSDWGRAILREVQEQGVRSIIAVIALSNPE